MDQRAEMGSKMTLWWNNKITLEVNTAVFNQNWIWQTQSNQYNQQQTKTNPKQNKKKEAFKGSVILEKLKPTKKSSLLLLCVTTLLLIIILLLSSHLTTHAQNIKSQTKLCFLKMKISCSLIHNYPVFY